MDDKTKILQEFKDSFNKAMSIINTPDQIIMEEDITQSENAELDKIGAEILSEKSGQETPTEVGPVSISSNLLNTENAIDSAKIKAFQTPQTEVQDKKTTLKTASPKQILSLMSHNLKQIRIPKNDKKVIEGSIEKLANLTEFIESGENESLKKFFGTENGKEYLNRIKGVVNKYDKLTGGYGRLNIEVKSEQEKSEKKSIRENLKNFGSKIKDKVKGAGSKIKETFKRKEKEEVNDKEPTIEKPKELTTRESKEPTKIEQVLETEEKKPEINIDLKDNSSSIEVEPAKSDEKDKSNIIKFPEDSEIGKKYPDGFKLSAVSKGEDGQEKREDIDLDGLSSKLIELGCTDRDNILKRINVNGVDAEEAEKIKKAVADKICDSINQKLGKEQEKPNVSINLDEKNKEENKGEDKSKSVMRSLGSINDKTLENVDKENSNKINTSALSGVKISEKDGVNATKMPSVQQKEGMVLTKN